MKVHAIHERGISSMEFWELSLVIDDVYDEKVVTNQESYFVLVSLTFDLEHLQCIRLF